MLLSIAALALGVSAAIAAPKASGSLGPLSLRAVTPQAAGSATRKPMTSEQRLKRQCDRVKQYRREARREHGDDRETSIYHARIAARNCRVASDARWLLEQPTFSVVQGPPAPASLIPEGLRNPPLRYGRHHFKQWRLSQSVSDVTTFLTYDRDRPFQYLCLGGAYRTEPGGRIWPSSGCSSAGEDYSRGGVPSALGFYRIVSTRETWAVRRCFAVWGAARDGVVTVRLIADDGSLIQEAPVVNNTFVMVDLPFGGYVRGYDWAGRLVYEETPQLDPPLCWDHSPYPTRGSRATGSRAVRVAMTAHGASGENDSPVVSAR